VPDPTTTSGDFLSLDDLQFPESLEPAEVARVVAVELKLKPTQTVATLTLLDDGNTVPFIARYRKEATGNLDEVQIQAIGDRADALRTLHARKHDVLRLIAEQGKLTRDLADAIIAATTLQAVEDVAAALAGARDICDETIMEDATVRGEVRTQFFKEGALGAKLTVDPEKAAEKDPRGVYRMYYDFHEPVPRLVPHRILALNRAEREDVLRVSVDVPFERAEPLIHNHYQPDRRSPFAEELETAISDGYRRLLAPALEREVRAELTRQAEEHAIGVFATNLRNLLLQPPLRGERVLGLDPGFRTGCKVAVVDETGKPIDSTTVYPHPPQERWAEAKATLKALIATHRVGVIAIGNGTASRETEQLAAEVIAELEKLGTPAGSLGYVMVNEAGASVYSASEVARQEFPSKDATERGTISIARRLQDPLAELVKIDPKAIGVGLYQHDVDQRALATALDRIVDSCVNFAGVDLNSASSQLLRHVSGITTRIADNIVAWRAEHGPFASRQQLLKVSGLGPATFVQAAGFLKVPGGKEPLDNTFIHPESYDATRSVLKTLPGSLDERAADRVRSWRMLIGMNSRGAGAQAAITALAGEVNVGVPTLTDILENLEKPGLVPRDSLPKPILRQDVL